MNGSAVPEPIARNLLNNLNGDLRTGQKSTYVPPVQGPTTTLEELNPRRFEGPKYFGYHSDSSLLARIAQMGLAPNGVNLKVVQEMLRYGLPIGFASVEALKSRWKQNGSSPLALEGLVLMASLGISSGKLDSVMQLLSGGPLSHQLARLTMAIKNGLSPQLKDMERLLQNYWRLGSGDLQAEGKLFQQFYGDLRRMAANPRMSPEIAQELAKLEGTMEAQRLLSVGAIYVPFFLWRDKLPLPGELLVAKDDSPAAQSAGFVQLNLAIETKNLGRITVGLTLLRETLSCHVDVQNPHVQQLFQSKIDLLRARLNLKSSYTVSSLQCRDVGQARTISILLPKRRDVRRIGRAIGVM
ncbi:MAG TPA: hypothetical protein DD435_12940 [Cyanobacteria bacterium UBA8530]|nr:hypothetical protein [Cyanobacteria bacterium UBA8530]